LSTVADRTAAIATDLPPSDKPTKARRPAGCSTSPQPPPRTVTLPESALPVADDDKPGHGATFEHAAELSDDARRHLATTFHLLTEYAASSHPSTDDLSVEPGFSHADHPNT
jgi:hypothetical protein